MENITAIIIGAGPAGLTAAYELLDKTNIKPIIYELTADIGGIAKTVQYKGNRIDIGGHRFFSKSESIMQWWQKILPLQDSLTKNDSIIKRNNSHIKGRNASDPENIDRVMLIRNRISRIFFLGKLFDYPISLNFNTLSNLGLMRVIKIGLSYIKIRIFPLKDEKSLEDFFINRFGKELYLTFFKDYTQKVWGVPCERIKPEWGAQRVKGLSITKTILDALKNKLSKDSSINQKDIETSLIRQFMYPKLGPGQLWEEVARIIQEKGGEIYLNKKVVGLTSQDKKMIEVKVEDRVSGGITTKEGNYFFSTMPVKELIRSFGKKVPQEVHEVAEGLLYRDFITAGLLLRKLKIKNETKIKTINNIVPDNWIYIQEKDVRIGRLQIFNNWSPYMVKDKDTVWIGLEYFCNEEDELWNKPDDSFIELAIGELSKIDIIEKNDVLDSVVIRMSKVYPAYFGTYERFHIIRNYVDQFENLFLIGRNGMHRYNNQDHSMLSAMTAVENITNNIKSKGNIWDVNIEKEYHEKR